MFATQQSWLVQIKILEIVLFPFSNSSLVPSPTHSSPSIMPWCLPHQDKTTWHNTEVSELNHLTAPALESTTLSPIWTHFATVSCSYYLPTCLFSISIKIPCLRFKLWPLPRSLLLSTHSKGTSYLIYSILPFHVVLFIFILIL